MVAGADRDAMAVEDLGDVVAVDALELEGHRAEALGGGRGAEDAQAGDGGDSVEGVVRDLVLVCGDRVHPERVEPANRRREADRLGDRGGAASKRAGGSAQVVLSFVTLRIIEPPPRNGGISRSRSSRPQSTPMPVGA